MEKTKYHSFNLYIVLRDLLYNFWVIVLAFLIGFISVETYCGFVYVPKYKSSMTVAVNVSGSNASQNISKTIEIAGILQNVFQSDVMKKIIRENGSDFELANVSASVVEQTNLLKISAEGTNAVDAYKTLKAVYENYENVFDKNLFEDVYIDEITYPTVSAAPYNTVSSKKRAVLIGVALSFACAALIVLFSLLRETVKQETDIEKNVDAPLFGEIYHQHINRAIRKKARNEKSGVKISVLNPMMGYAFCESINRVATKIEYLKNSRKAKSFIITSVDEHEGKTTVSVNVAMNLASKGYKTLIIDADLRRPSVYSFFSPELFNENSELGNYILGKALFKDIVLHDEASKLDIIGGKNSYRFAFEFLNSKRFEKLLKMLYNQFDYIIIDTPPTSLTADTESIADIVDVMLLVIRQDSTPIPQINDTVDVLSNAGSFFAGCILNDYRDVYSSVFKGRMSESRNYGTSYYYG